jgi:hypothetical protein
MNRSQQTNVLVGLLLLIATAANADESSKKSKSSTVAAARTCSIDLLDAGDGSSLKQRRAELEQKGFQVAHQGLAKDAHEQLEIFVNAGCDEAGSRVAQALSVPSKDVHPANWKTSYGVTIALSGEGEAEVGREPSRFGKFELTEEGGSCTLKFRSTSNQVTNLLSVDACSRHSPLMQLRQVREKDFPLTSSGGVEFHLFSISTARGGNACDGDNYWAVVVSAKRVWATSKSFADCADVRDAEVNLIDDPDRPSLRFVQAANPPYWAGTEYEISTAGVRKTKQPMPEPESEETEIIEGKLGPGWRGAERTIKFANDEPNFDITEKGKCDLDSISDDTPVKMTVKTRTWKDDRKSTMCVRVKTQ